MRYNTDILGFYDYFREANSLNDATSVGWTSKESQYKRFKALFDIGVTSDDEILDLGCGLGHMVDFMIDNDIQCKHYHGIDINSSNIGLSISRHPTKYFSVGDIFDVEDEYDYIFCSGTFTVFLSFDEIMASIDRCYALSHKGVAFNLLDSSFLAYDNINSFEPNSFFSELSNKYGNCELVNNYLPGEDFTIYMRK